MNHRNNVSVLANQRRSYGLPWMIPLTLPITEEQAQSLRSVERVVLTGEDGQVYALLDLDEVFRYDREAEAQQVLLTTEDKHPGVQYMRSVAEAERPSPKGPHVSRSS